MILQEKVDGMNDRSLARFILRARRVVRLRGQVNLLVTSNAAMRSLNRQFRGHNQTTDVLSFPAAPPVLKSARPVAGEVAISADVALENSLRLGHSMAQEVKILALHGILHLAGFDHERDHGQMARKEAALRRTLRLPAALIERTKLERVRASAARRTP